MLFRWRVMFWGVVWKRSAISAWLIQIVSSAKRHSTRVRPSSVC
jgi:hypothetical protein